MIGLSKSQKDRQVKNVKENLLVNNGYKMFEKGIFDVNNKCVAIEMKYLPIWLSSINRKSLKDNQYQVIINLLNWCLSIDFDKYKTPSKIYTFETELRDEIYDIGWFNNIKIIGKEVSYDFGRIDLLGLDLSKKSICIEIKKYKEFDDTKEQLLKYKNSQIFYRIIYCAYIINEEFKLWCKNNDIEIYTYERKLQIKSA